MQDIDDMSLQNVNDLSMQDAVLVERNSPPAHAVARLAFAALAGALLSACSMLPTVQPWEKGNLAKPAMTFSGDALDERFTQHIYNSKENASGGYGVGGGGCGCN